MSAARIVLATGLCGFLLSVPGTPQQQQQPPNPQPQQRQAPSPDEPSTRIRVSVDEVIVPVTVTDDKGRYVSNLKAEDFRILDEGVPQRIQFFSHTEKQPVVVGFLVDLSNQSRIHWKTYQDAIQELVWNLLPGDERYSGYLITYSTEAEIAVNTTTDSQKIADRVAKLKPGGGAALYDAIYKACTTRSLVKGEPYEPRRVIIVVGDGHNSAGDHTLDEVLELAKRKMVTIFGISTMAYGFANEDKAVLERLTRETGGQVQYPLFNPYQDVAGYLSTPQDAGNYSLQVGTGSYQAQISASIVKAVANVSGEITTQYVLRYQPDIDPESKPKSFRTIKVEVPSLPAVTVRARDGYFPQGVPQTPAGK